MHCDFAFFIGGTHENVAQLPELERLPAAPAAFMGSSTGSLLVPDDDGVEAILRAISRRASFHPEDEYRLPRSGFPARARRPLLAPGVARCRSGDDLDPRRLALARKTGKRVHIPRHLHRRRGWSSSPPTRSRGERRGHPHHLTLDETAYTRLEPTRR